MTQLEQERSVSERLKHLWHEGMVRHVTMRKGDIVPMNVPLNLVVLATLVAPWLVAIAAVIGLLKGYSIEMSREPESNPAPAAGDSPDEQPPVAPGDVETPGP